MKAWLDCNPEQFAYVNADGDEIINGENYIYIILSCLYSPKESHFVEIKLQKLANGDVQLHN